MNLIRSTSKERQKIVKLSWRIMVSSKSLIILGREEDSNNDEST